MAPCFLHESMRIIRAGIPARLITRTARKEVPGRWRCLCEIRLCSLSSRSRSIRKRWAKRWRCIATLRKRRARRNPRYSGTGYDERPIFSPPSFSPSRKVEKLRHSDFFFSQFSIRHLVSRLSRLASRYLIAQRDGASIQRNRAKTVGGNLTIESLRRSDFGFYQCVASNEVATISASTQLIVEGTQPHAPYNVTGTATEFSVTLTWLPGYSGGPDYKQDYTIW